MSKILIVDDAPVNLDMLSTILSANPSYEIETATSGINALTAIQKEPPDIILLDIVMPDMDGFEVCYKLKNEEDVELKGKYADIPILFISAMGESAEKVRGLQLGAADYVTKPINVEELVARVATHIRIKEAEQEKLQVQKLQSIKEMIITYHHEMNQPLTVVLGYAEILLDQVDENDPNYATLQIIKEQVGRLVEILDKIKFLETAEVIQTREYIHGRTMIDLESPRKSNK